MSMSGTGSEVLEPNDSLAAERESKRQRVQSEHVPAEWCYGAELKVCSQLRVEDRYDCFVLVAKPY